MSSIGEPQRIIIVEPLAEPIPRELPEMPAEPVRNPEVEEPAGV
jgi:hypothetical protein